MVRIALANFHHSPHQDMMTGKGADIRIVTLGSWSGEGHLLFLAMIDQARMPQDIGAFGNKGHSESFRTQSECLLGNGVRLVRLGHDQVVGHEIGIRKNKLYLLSGLDREFA